MPNPICPRGHFSRFETQSVARTLAARPRGPPGGLPPATCTTVECVLRRSTCSDLRRCMIRERCVHCRVATRGLASPYWYCSSPYTARYCSAIEFAPSLCSLARFLHSCRLEGLYGKAVPSTRTRTATGNSNTESPVVTVPVVLCLSLCEQRMIGGNTVRTKPAPWSDGA